MLWLQVREPKGEGEDRGGDGYVLEAENSFLTSRVYFKGRDIFLPALPPLSYLAERWKGEVKLK